jgi:2,3-dihydroxybenzoate decarboxylase
LAPQDPHGAASELERAVVELGLAGANVNSHIKGSYLDDKKYWVIFEMAERYSVPILIHPNIPSSTMLEPYADYGYSLAGPALGFAAETSLHAMRLILSGVFDTYPKLKVILGHLGEGLPFWLSRMDFFWDKQGHKSGFSPGLSRKPSDYFKDNFIVTTSGMFFHPAALCTYLALGGDRIAFAVDYPFEENENAEQFVKSLPICETDKHKIFHQNAERLFKRTR